MIYFYCRYSVDQPSYFDYGKIGCGPGCIISLLTFLPRLMSVLLRAPFGCHGWMGQIRQVTALNIAGPLWCVGLTVMEVLV